jgi:disabled homolog 2
VGVIYIIIIHSNFFSPDGKSWYHSTDHQNWSPAEDERCSFDRSAYERSTYGPPYEKREPKSLTVYDRRGGSSSVGYDRRKYYRGGRSGHDYEYDDPYSEAGGRGHRRTSGGKLRKDYDDEYEAHYGGSGSRSDLSRGRDYFYERDKRSFDRESNESYESGVGGRRRKSFGSGDVYVDRYPAPPHPDTRSLRRGVSGRNNLRKQHPDDTQDSESDVMTGSGRRSGGSGDMNVPQRRQQQKMAMEEDEVWGPVPGSGEFEPSRSSGNVSTQKSWNRPSSASESERRLADRNRILMNPLSGSDGEDRRFRKKTRSARGAGGAKEVEDRRGLHYATMRHGQKYRNPVGDEYYDCEDPVEYASDDEQIGSEQTRGHHEDYDEDPASYYGRRPQPAYFRGSTSRLEGKSQDMIKGPRYAVVEADVPGGDRKFRKSTSRDFYTDDREPQRKYGDMSPKSGGGKHVRMEFNFENYAPTATTPQSSGNSNIKKFNFEESGEGFESDFLNSPPAAPANSAGTGSGSGQKAFRFSNDFSDKDSPARQPATTTSNSFGFEADFANNSTKLRFNETVKVAKFDKDKTTTTPTPIAATSFEDDFSSKTSFDEMEDQWNPEIPKKNNNSSKLRQQQHNKQQDNIKKSESINIFAKKIDPFDDPFFEESKNGNGSDNNNSARGSGGDFGWNRSFANFEDNNEM